MFEIYQLTNTVNGKSYIGFTTQGVEVRLKRHTKQGKTVISKAIAKYGIENFSVEILEVGENTEYGKNIAECLYIHWKKPEYNKTPGGDGTGSGTLSAKYGMKLSKETKEKIRKSMLGRHADANTRSKMKQSHMGLFSGDKHPLYNMRGKDNPNYGSKRTPEQRERMRIAQQKRRSTE